MDPGRHDEEGEREDGQRRRAIVSRSGRRATRPTTTTSDAEQRAAPSRRRRPGPPDGAARSAAHAVASGTAPATSREPRPRSPGRAADDQRPGVVGVDGEVRVAARRRSRPGRRGRGRRARTARQRRSSTTRPTAAHERPRSADRTLLAPSSQVRESAAGRRAGSPRPPSAARSAPPDQHDADERDEDPELRLDRSPRRPPDAAALRPSPPEPRRRAAGRRRRPSRPGPRRRCRTR